jgi:transposase
MKKGAPWLKTTLVQCAWAAARTKDSYFHAQYHRLRSRRGPKKAIGAVASSLLTTAYHMLKSGTLYQDPSALTTSTIAPKTSKPCTSFTA